MAWTYQAQVDLSDQWVNRATGEVSNIEPSERNAVAAWNTWQAAGGDPASLLPSWVAEYLPRAAYQPDRQGWFDFEFGGKRYRLNQGNPWIAETSNSGWLVYLRDPYFTGYNSAEVVYVADLRARLKEANAGGLFDAMPYIIAVAGAAAYWNLAGSLSVQGAATDQAIEETVISLSDTGASSMGEKGLEWYSVDPGPDPFATTADVNAGWSYDGGYAGVDWYNNAGIGEAPDIWGSLSKAADAGASLVTKLGGILTTGTAALGTAQRNLTQGQPNYTRAAGGMNLGLLAVAVMAWKLL